MKRPRPASIAGVLVGSALLLTAAHLLPGCSTLPPYIGIGFHFTTTPPTPRDTATASTALAPRSDATPQK